MSVPCTTDSRSIRITQPLVRRLSYQKRCTFISFSLTIHNPAVLEAIPLLEALRHKGKDDVTG